MRFMKFCSRCPEMRLHRYCTEYRHRKQVFIGTRAYACACTRACVYVHVNVHDMRLCACMSACVPTRASVCTLFMFAQSTRVAIVGHLKTSPACHCPAVFSLFRDVTRLTPDQTNPSCTPSGTNAFRNTALLVFLPVHYRRDCGHDAMRPPGSTHAEPLSHGCLVHIDTLLARWRSGAVATTFGLSTKRMLCCRSKHGTSFHSTLLQFTQL